MKAITYLCFSILLATFLMPSCNLVDEVNQFDFDADFSAELEVMIPPEIREVNFHASASIDPTTNSDFSKHFNEIKEIHINEIIGVVAELDEDFKIIETTITIYSDTHSTQWSFFDIDLTGGIMFVLGNDEGQWEIVRKVLNENKTFTVEIDGVADKGDIYFRVLTSIRTTVYAES